MDFKRYENEKDDELIYRICSQKDLIGRWCDVRDILNELLGYDYSDSAYRKKYQYFTKILEANRERFTDSDARLEEINEKKRELECARIKFRDERNAWSKQNHIKTRVEDKLDCLEEKFLQISKVNFETHNTPKINSDNEMIICLSDLHIGQTFNSTFGQYNTDIARTRLGKYLNKIIETAKLHNVKKAHVVSLGDQISSSIHKTLAITNRENVIDQIKIATEYISTFCYELTKHFETVLFYSCSGNHSRIDRKDEALHSERLDDVIAWGVNLSLQHIDNFNYLQHRNLDIGIVDINVCGKSFIACHGDFDPMTKQGVANLSMMLGWIPYGILRGHMHYPAMNELNGVKVIQSGSLAGSGDDHTIECRLIGKPSQTFCICNKDGIDCIYNVELS